jgi:hypothetical protein
VLVGQGTSDRRDRRDDRGGMARQARNSFSFAYTARREPPDSPGAVPEDL